MQKKKKKLKDFAPQNNSITISLSVAITFLGRFLIIRMEEPSKEGVRAPYSRMPTSVTSFPLHSPP